jgi:hypothetical protein
VAQAELGAREMSGFSAEWLALREPADHAARSIGVTCAAIESLPDGATPRILDLASGTGSNFRYLTAAGFKGTRRSEFLLVDHDPALLARIPANPDVATRCMDLSTLDDRSIFDGRALVTASALLDLVSEAWLGVLADRCAEQRSVVLFALSYDGRIACSPEDPADATIVALVNEHQRTDKGFGRALGPDATDGAERGFRRLGYRVQRSRSDWTLPPASGALQRALIDGWAQAATEIAASETIVIDAWRRRRQAHVDANRSRMIVGHEDLAAWPDGTNRGDR